MAEREHSAPLGSAGAVNVGVDKSVVTVRCEGSNADAEPSWDRRACPVCGRYCDLVGRGTGAGWGRPRYPRHNRPKETSDA